MSPWLRLDEGFAEHWKLLELELEERWAWVEVLLYCARRREHGRVTLPLLDRYGLEAPRLLELGLLDRDEDGALWVHDFDEYNGARSDAERKRESRARQYGADYYGKPIGEHGGRRGTYVNRHGSVKSRDGHEEVTTGEGDGSVSTHTRVPHPQRASTPQRELQGAGSDDLDFGGALKVARLLQAIGEVGLEDADEIRGLASRSSEAVVARIVESLNAGGVRDRVAYAKTTLRNELAGGARGVTK